LINLGRERLTIRTAVLSVAGFIVLVVVGGDSVTYRTDHQKAKDCVKQNQDKYNIELGEDKTMHYISRELALRACETEIKADRTWKGRRERQE
jgi:hypothetical protein